jgi:preprotein translocase SecF subunit
MRFLKKTNIDFIGNRNIFYYISIAFLVIGAIATLLKGITFGIDFTGGTELILKFNHAADVGTVRSAITNSADISGAEIKTYGDPTQILIRVKEIDTSSLNRIKQSITTNLPDNKWEILKEDKIGPKIGEELKIDAIYAISLSILVILIYLAFRFEFVYALGAVVGIFHDILVVFGLCVLFNGIHPWLNLEFSQTLIASFLTLIGFSINDTVVIYDRIRENRKLNKTENLISIINRSINDNLSRTIITSLTVFITLAILFFFGGEVNRSFAFSFMVGVIVAIYSSVFISGAFIVEWYIYIKKQPLEETYKKA